MKQLTELEKKIYIRINAPGIANGQAVEIVKSLSQFFLEEIKEALIDFEFQQITENLRSDYLKDGIKLMVSDYLKSKYNIED